MMGKGTYNNAEKDVLMELPKMKLERRIFILSGVLLTLLFAFFLGMAVRHFSLFPYPQVKTGFFWVKNIFFEGSPLYVQRHNPNMGFVYAPEKQIGNPFYAVRLLPEDPHVATVYNREGDVLHEWTLDVFDIWENFDHLQGERFIPKERTNGIPHGTVVTPEGNLVVNFDYIGMVCFSPEGSVLWKLDIQSHHSLMISGGSIWSSGIHYHLEKSDDFPGKIPPFFESQIFEVSYDGKLLNLYSVNEILMENGLIGLLHSGTINNTSTELSGDILHINDAEPFSEHMEPGFFGPGDILVSARNINTIFVFNKDTRKIKYISIGVVVRQHDPDFLDGNRISVFDNFNIARDDPNVHSRIVILDASTGTHEVFFQGSEDFPFFTNILGKHQFLPNGHVLVTSGTEGRAFEVDASGKLHWEYNNVLDSVHNSWITEVSELPESVSERFSE
jgi:hypothetical protein